MTKSYVDKWSKETCRLMRYATDFARYWQHKFLKPEHILAGLLKVNDTKATHFLEEIKIDVRRLNLLLKSSFKLGKRRYLAPGVGVEHHMLYTTNTVRVMTYATKEFMETRSKEIEPLHVLKGLLKTNYRPINRILKQARKQEQ